MVTEFCGFNKGVIGKKLPSDSTLKNMRKEELINLLRLAQHNYGNLVWFYNNAVNANMAQLNNNGWIPCSERMPNKEEYLKDDGRFIVTDGNRVYQSIYDIYIHHWFRTLKLFNFGAGENPSYEVDNCVIAWMPLPAPYQQKEGD